MSDLSESQIQGYMDALNSEFTSTDGCIMDSTGRPWILWKTTDLYAWWHAFEASSRTPLGRKFMNACADQEEYFLRHKSMLDVGWFRRSKRQQDVIQRRWNTYGWGSFNVVKESAQTLLFAPVAAGFALASKEQLAGQRFKSEWQQLGQKTIQFEWTPDPANLPPAPELPVLPWGAFSSLAMDSVAILSELEWLNGGWALAGESVTFLPMDAFTRLFHTCRAYQHTLDSEHINAWLTPQLTDGDRSVFLMIAASMAGLVQSSERPIYIEGTSSWSTLTGHYLAPYGWGRPVNVESLESPHGVRFKLIDSPMLPFLVGWLVAMWERGHGRSSKFSLERLDAFWLLEVDSRLEYN